MQEEMGTVNVLDITVFKDIWLPTVTKLLTELSRVICLLLGNENEQ
jgi:hypothetical protein